MILRDEPCLADVVVARDGEGDTSRPVAPCIVAFQVVWSMDEPHKRYVSPAMFWNEANDFALRTDAAPGMYAEEIRPVWGWPKSWFAHHKVDPFDIYKTKADVFAIFIAEGNPEAALEYAEWLDTLQPDMRNKVAEAFASAYEKCTSRSAL